MTDSGHNGVLNTIGTVLKSSSSAQPESYSLCGPATPLQFIQLFILRCRPVNVFPPGIFRSEDPRPLLHIYNIVAKTLDAATDIAFQSIYDRKNKDNGKDADGNSQQAQERAQFVRA